MGLKGIEVFFLNGQYHTILQLKIGHSAADDIVYNWVIDYTLCMRGRMYEYAIVVVLVVKRRGTTNEMKFFLTKEEIEN